MDLGVEVDDRTDGDPGVGVAAPALDLCEQHQTLALVEVTERVDLEALAQRGLEVEVQLKGPGRRKVGGWGRRVSRRATGGEVEGELVAGEETEGHGASGAERLRGAEGFELGGTGSQRVVEVEGIGEVELGGDLGGAAVADLTACAGVDGDVAGLRALGVRVV